MSGQHQAGLTRIIDSNHVTRGSFLFGACMNRRYASHRKWRYAKSIDELAVMCRRRLPAFAWEYVQAGAEDERTLADNRRAFADVGWRPRTLVDTSTVDTRDRLLDDPCAMPLAIAPTGYNGMLWRDADIALAEAARQHGVPFVLSTVSCNSLEEVAAAVPDGCHWFQLYPFHDEGITRDLLDRAGASGFETLVVTTDAVTLGRREWDARSYVGPGRLGWQRALEAMCHARWFKQALWPRGLPTMGNLLKYLSADQRSAMGALEFTSQQFAKALDWTAIGHIREYWPGRLVIKGILDADDARHACVVGADGIVVTNHGGRQLDGAPPTLSALPPIVEATPDEFTVLLDSGIRRGGDIAKAIALGADGVLIGRATLYGLALGGQDGASHALTLLHEQLHNTMALLGRPNLAMLDNSCVYYAAR